MATGGAASTGKHETPVLGHRHKATEREASPILSAKPPSGDKATHSSSSEKEKEKEDDDLNVKMSGLKISESSDKRSKKEPIALQPRLSDALSEVEKAKTAKERVQALDHVLVDVTEADRLESQSAVDLHKQDLTVGRIHNHVDKTAQNLDDAEDELHQTESCCFAMFRCLFGKCACSSCCKPKEPHHDIEMERQHPAPVLMSDAATSASPKPLTEKQKRQAILDKLRHQEGTLEGEISELKDANGELDVINEEVDKTKKRTKEEADKSKIFVAANKSSL